MSDYFIAYKPFQVLSQFTSQQGKQTLKDFFTVPKDVYPLGRLDYDSEGLLILTNDKQLNYQLLHPGHEHEREYWVEVEGQIDQAAIAELQSGVTINIAGDMYQTKKCKAGIFIDAPDLPERNPPVRFRKNIPTSWIWIILKEGKNRQVRKMTAKFGFPTLRLVRYRIEKLSIEKLSPGEIIAISKNELYKKLFD